MPWPQPMQLVQKEHEFLLFLHLLWMSLLLSYIDTSTILNTFMVAINITMPITTIRGPQRRQHPAPPNLKYHFFHIIPIIIAKNRKYFGGPYSTGSRV